ncbi:MAG: deoxyribonuclease IV, partial [Candidatus Paceibacterota bacterium]
IKHVAEKTSDLKSKIILEITAGQGTELGFRLEELAEIYNAIDNKKKVKICLDTAHIFGGGYDLRQEKNCLSFIAEAEKLIGLDNVACIHFNDSKKALGSRVDRHQDIGKGEIGEDGLRAFFAQLNSKVNGVIPFILETPEEFLSYADQIKMIREWKL